MVERYVDEIVTVDEDEIASAILMLLEREKTLAEGAGAAALAALLQQRTSLKGAHTAVLVCGGNIDVTLLSRIIERGLVQDGRLIRLRIHLLDKPGALHELTRLDRGSSREHRGYAAQPRVLRREPGRYGHRHHDGDARAGAGGGAAGSAYRRRVPPQPGAVGVTRRAGPLVPGQAVRPGGPRGYWKELRRLVPTPMQAGMRRDRTLAGPGTGRASTGPQ